LGIEKIQNPKSIIKECLQTQASSQRFFTEKGNVTCERLQNTFGKTNIFIYISKKNHLLKGGFVIFNLN